MTNEEKIIQLLTSINEQLEVLTIWNCCGLPVVRAGESICQTEKQSSPSKDGK